MWRRSLLARASEAVAAQCIDVGDAFIAAFHRTWRCVPGEVALACLGICLSRNASSGSSSGGVATRRPIGGTGGGGGGGGRAGGEEGRGGRAVGGARSRAGERGVWG